MKMKKIKMNKSGTIQEIFLIIIVLFLVAVSFLIAKTVYDPLSVKMANQFKGTESANVIQMASTLFNVFDGLFLFMVIGLGLAAIILAFNVDFHPVFYIFTVIIAAIGTIIAAIFSNAWGNMTGAGGFATAAGTFTSTDFIMDNLVLFIVGIAFLIIIFMFARSRSGE